ncbi:glycine betaine ABC transporter substrate-binding protein OsmF [Neoroseomonas soli]|uniref:ABC transporter substrate-binding protein n=1 Tax=Neoroseomonas soli TaxID=1081025 RepID=A0A9X9X4C1_9PROT|nr:ABC transporter substrate-binding protein [Neoroseomonas soli]MBR0674250.1 ABC transporter substrate-binding protein [Neoroseomonas soli]
MTRINGHAARRHLLLGAAALASAPALAQARPIVVASKIDTEGGLLGQMIALLLEAGGMRVENRVPLGPTRIVRTAILAGEIDIYPEYTGNGAFFFQIEADPVWKDARAGYEKVRDLDAQRNDIVWLQPAPANNTWAIAVRADLARTHGLRTLEDLARHLTAGRPFKLAGSSEFVESPAALPAFQRAYGFTLPPDRLLVLPGGDTAVTMRAAAQQLNGVNAAMVYGTDGGIAALDLVVLEDTKGAQPVYAPAPIVRGAVLRANPRIAEVLAPAFRTLELTVLQRLNARIAVEGQPAREVARAHLAAAGLLR